MKDLHSTENPKLTCVLVGVASKQQESEQVIEYLDELEFLARTYNLETMRVFTQRLEKPDKATYIGKGKVEEISSYVKENKIHLLRTSDNERIVLEIKDPIQLEEFENKKNFKCVQFTMMESMGMLRVASWDAMATR